MYQIGCVNFERWVRLQQFEKEIMTEYLDSHELQRLTAAARATRQAAWLKAHGIPHQRDGKRVIASRVHVQAWLEGRPRLSSNGPNWSALNRA